MTDNPNGQEFQWFPDPDATVPLTVDVAGEVATLQVKRCLTVHERDTIEELWLSGKTGREKIRESIVRLVKDWTLTYPGGDKPVPIALDSLTAMHAHGIDAIWAVIDPHLAELSNLYAGPTLPQVKIVYALLRKSDLNLPDLTEDALASAWRAAQKGAVATDPPRALRSASG